MTDEKLQFDELSPLLAALCDGTLDREGFSRLERLLASDPAARRWYISYLDLHGELQWNHLAAEQRAPVEPREAPEAEAKGSGAGDQGPVFSPPATGHRPSIPPIITDPSTTHSSLGSWAISYAVATVFVCFLILGAWAVKISHRHEFADNNSRRQTASGLSAEEPEMVFVGRITGMADVEWSQDPDYLPPAGIHVSLGREYKLSSGLMQITYDSGAKVILEGPCSYKVESTRGGYLALGKLTAKVETKGPGARGQGSGAGKSSGFRGQGSEIEKPHPRIPKSPSPRPPIPDPFIVRTPTALVTDLGTEFGVEVAENGDACIRGEDSGQGGDSGIRGCGDAGCGETPRDRGRGGV